MSSGAQPVDTCLTTSELKKLLSFANRGLKCDTLTAYYDKEIQTLDQINEKQQEQLQLCEGVALGLANDLEVTKKKLKWVSFGAILLGITTIIFILF